MKKLFTLSFILFSFFAQADYWTQKANFPGTNRDACFSFSIGTNGYVGSGRDANLNYVSTFWKYDKLTNTWTQKADFAGDARVLAAGFALIGKGYVCCGSSSGSFMHNDVWQYDTTANNWIQKLNFPGAARLGAVSFVIQNYAYLSCGLSGSQYLNDLWEYEPVTDTWTIKPIMPGIGRISPIAFAADDKGYIGCGYRFTSPAGYPKDFYEYDPVFNQWSAKVVFPASGRCQVANFNLSDKGYIGAGDSTGTIFFNDFWQYDALTDIWYQKTNIPGPARNECISFSIGNNGYVGLGQAVNSFPNDFWEYTPDSSTSITELTLSKLEFTISPNPVNEFIAISYPSDKKENLELTISDAHGKKVYKTKLLTSVLRLPTSDFQKGIYIVELNNGKQKAVKKFIKE